MFIHPLTPDYHLALIEKRHAKPFFDFIDTNRQHFTGILQFIDTLKTEKDALDTIQFILKMFAEGKGFTWGIWDKKKLIGFIGMRDINEVSKSAEISSAMDKDYQGKGIISKACLTAIDYLFTEYDVVRLVLRCDVVNAKSQSIAKKFGFTNEGIARKSIMVNGELLDCYVWSLLRDEYFENKKAKKYEPAPNKNK